MGQVFVFRLLFLFIFYQEWWLSVMRRPAMLGMGNCLYRYKQGIKKPLTWVSGCCHQISAVRYQAGCLPSSAGGGRAAELDSTFCSSPCMFLM